MCLDGFNRWTTTGNGLQQARQWRSLDSQQRIASFPICLLHTLDLFVVRNVGNIIPAYGTNSNTEGAAIEYAVHALGIKDIILCGHSYCGAMKGLLQIGTLAEEMPLVYDWLKQHAEATRRLVVDNYKECEPEELLNVAIKQNVLTQIENLKTYPVVRSKLHSGSLNLHAWVYEIEAGVVFAYNASAGLFIPLEQRSFPVPDPLLAEDSRGRWLWLQALIGSINVK